MHNTGGANPGISLLLSISLLSCAALAYEVLLTRLFAIIQWHHFAYMIISLALLGYGASGSFLALFRTHAMRRFRALFIINAALFAITGLAGFLIAQRLPFNPLEIAWNPWQLSYLLAYYLLLTIPFFCVANCFGLTLLVYRRQLARVYAFDLAGAGFGALTVILLLSWLHPLDVLLLLSALACCAVALVNRRWIWLLLLPVLGFVLPADWLKLQLSQYKALSQSLQVAGAELIAERSGPLGLINTVRNTQVPFRYAPGMSLNATQGPGEQLALFSDGDPLGVITYFDGNVSKLDYLDQLASALPYHLLDQPEVLILGAGGGNSVLQAMYFQAGKIDAVELNGQVVDLLRGDFADFAGRLYDRSNIDVHIAEARAFVSTSRDQYDLIQIDLLDAFSTAAAGLYALNESYLYTEEALRDYIEHLKAGGLLSITRWLRAPPRDSLKLFATAISALRQAGVEQPGLQLVLVRGWNTSTLLVKNGVFSQVEIEALTAFCRQRSFDTAYFPGIAAAQANRFNRLSQPYLYEGAQALLGDRKDDFLQQYKFNLQPASDDQPYFFHFFVWRTLPELLTLGAGSGFAQLEWGYLVLVATLLQALVLSVILIVLPLLGKRRRHSPVYDRWRILVYFSALGLGFLFLEIAFMQKLVLFLGHPLYAVAVVLAAFLLFAGLGSAYAQSLLRQRLALPFVLCSIVAITFLYLLFLPGVFDSLWAWPPAWRIATALVLIAPLAFCLGLPFPLALARIDEQQIPWAWAINGCASVISAVLATLLAMEIGFSGVVMAGAILYLLAVLAAPRFIE